MNTVFETNVADFPLYRGKVRDVYEIDTAHAVLVATDRVSVFDRILPTPIPGKGKALTAISAFWFKLFEKEAIFNTHFLSNNLADMPAPFRNKPEIFDGRCTLVRRCKVFPVECVVRGNLVGSAWKYYQKSGKTTFGETLPPGLQEGHPFPDPIFTPTTKSQSGDKPLDSQELREHLSKAKIELHTWRAQPIIDVIKAMSITAYKIGQRVAFEKGLNLIDCKFEFGHDPNHKIMGGDISEIQPHLMIVDEVMTPDCARYWPHDQYRIGGGSTGLDKQFIRNYIDRVWTDRTVPPPELNSDCATYASKYIYQRALDIITEVQKNR